MLDAGSILQGRYRIERVLGQGGMGAVYLAREELLGGKRVAIKEMSSAIDPSLERSKAVEQFQKEAHMLASLDHPGLVDVTHYFEEDEKQYLVMAFIDGQTLEELVNATNDYLPVPTVLEWVDQIADVFEYLHGHHPPILFRDMKPSNVMLDSRQRIRLIDFGIARSLDSGNKTSTFIKGAGSAGFAPLEQYSRDTTTDPRTDIYSLGATLYAVLTATIPPSAVDLATHDAELVPPTELNPAISSGLEAVILKMMALRREDRYATMLAARQALRSAPTQATPKAAPVVKSAAKPVFPRFCSDCGAPTAAGQPTCPACGSVLELMDGVPEPKVPVLMPGSILEGRYMIRKKIGGGGMGTIYLAHLCSLESKRVAIKVLHHRYETPDQQDKAMQQFHREAAFIAQLDHPNLVRINDFFTVGGAAYLVMDYIDGVSMQDLLARLDGFLEASLALEMIYQLCDALEYLHHRDPPIVFRDLKPANIMVTEDARVKLIDFGIAYTMEAERGMTDSFLRGTGTHGFAPIEQYTPDGRTDPTSDIYALGATMYAIFTRKTPPAAVELVTGQRILVRPEAIDEDLPSELGLLIAKMMETQQSERCQTVAEVRQYLDLIFQARPTPDADLTSPATQLELCPRCQTHSPAGVPVCPGCGLQLEPDAVPLAAEPADRAPDDGAALKLASAARLEPARIQAVIQAPGTFLGFRKAHRVEAVEVLEVDPDHIAFSTSQEHPVPGTLQMLLTVPLPAASDTLDVPVRVSLTARTGDGNPVWHYVGAFKDLPDRIVPLLSHTQERRQVKRFRQGFQVLCRDLPKHYGLAVDVSPTGLGLTARGPLTIGTLADFTLELDGAETRAQVRAQIFHCAKRIDGFYRIGAGFLSMAEGTAETLLEYLRQLQEQE